MLVSAVGVAVYRAVLGHRSDDDGGRNGSTPQRHAPDWLAPVDDGCPPGYPIKANSNSSIYHLPGGRFYNRTAAQRCYATESTAQRDGYRRAKA